MMTKTVIVWARLFKNKLFFRNFKNPFLVLCAFTKTRSLITFLKNFTPCLMTKKKLTKRRIEFRHLGLAGF